MVKISDRQIKFDVNDSKDWNYMNVLLEIDKEMSKVNPSETKIKFLKSYMYDELKKEFPSLDNHILLFGRKSKTIYILERK